MTSAVGSWVDRVRVIVIVLIAHASCADHGVDGDTTTRAPFPRLPDGGAKTSDASASQPRPDAGGRCSHAGIDRAGLESRAREFANRHRVDTAIAFDACPADEAITCAPVTVADYPAIATFFDHVDDDLDAYPADFFAAIHLDRVVFVGPLATSEGATHALGGAVIPSGPRRSVMYLGAVQAGHCFRPLNVRTIHHEIAHAIDTGFTPEGQRDAWRSLNPAGFSYGDVDVHAANLLDFEHPREGLVTAYAGTSVAEDRAEVYTVLFMPKYREELEAWVQDDAWLHAKLRNVLRPLETRWPAFVEAIPNYDAVR
jgi:hypothetical protein